MPGDEQTKIYHSERYLRKRRRERRRRKERKRLAKIAAAEPVLRAMCERFPDCFSLGEFRAPLKINIRDELIAAMPEFAPELISDALRIYTGDILAYRAGFFVGAIRRDLSGDPAGEVSADEATHAGNALLDIEADAAAAMIARSVATVASLAA